MAADDRKIERLNPELAGRPDLMGGRLGDLTFLEACSFQEGAIQA